MKTITLRRVVVCSVFILGFLLTTAPAIKPWGETIPVGPGQSVTLLPNGQWLLIGGEGPKGPYATTSIWDPSTGTLTALSARLQHARAWHTATVLPDGTVFIFGGTGVDGELLADAELFDPDALSFTSPPASSLSQRSNHTATLLTDGRVLIAGGLSANGKARNDAEIWNFQDGAEQVSISKLDTARYNHSATLLANGNVLLAGGIDKNGHSLDDGDLFDPSTGLLTSVSASTIQNLKAEIQNPYLAASLPVNGSHDAAIDGLIAVRFSTPIRVETINTDTVVFNGPDGNEPIEVVPAESGMLAFVIPSDQLLPGATYTVTLNGASDNNGSMMPVSGFTFTTRGSLVGASTSTSTASGQRSGDGIASMQAADDWNGDWKDGKPYSPWQDLPLLQATAGVTALAGQVLDLTGAPLGNVVLKIEYDSGDITALTDETGRFLLVNLTAGWRELVIDGRQASRRPSAQSSSLTPPDNYGLFQYRLEIKDGVTTVLPFTSWLPKIDTAHATQVPSPTASEVVLTTPQMPDFELHIAAGTTIREYDGKIVTEVSITPIPQDRTPFPLPEGMMFPVYTTIQPGGAYLSGSRGAWIVYPNKTDAPPGSRADLWHYDPEERGWYIYGQGTVTPDGTQIVPDPDVSFYSFTGAGATFTNKNPPGISPPAGGSVKAGDPIDLATGLHVLQKTDILLADVLPIVFTRTYRTLDTVSRSFGRGATNNFEIVLSGAGGTDFSFVDLILPDGGKVHYNRISPGTGFVDAVFEHTATPSIYFKTQISFNSGTSRWDLKLKDGTFYSFGPHSGLLLAIKDRNGNQITITRTMGENGNISTIASPNGRFLQFTYDTSNRITQIADNSGRTVGYTYDGNGRVSKVTDPNGGATNYTYDSSHRMTTIKDPRTIVFLTNTYDANGRVSKQTQKDATTFLFSYTLDGSGKVTQTDVTDPRGNIRRVTFNTDGYMLSDTRALTKPEQQTVTYVRQAGSNLILSETDELNRKTAYTYDTSGNVLTITRLADTPNAVTTTFTYEPTFNQLATIADPLNHTTTFGYDTNGNLTSVTNALNKTTTITPNSAGQPVAITDPLSNTTTFTYSSGNLVSITDPSGITTTRAFDAVARLQSITDPLGNQTQYLYDPLNELTQITDPLAGVTAFTYDPNGRLLTVKDARLKTTTYTYDNMDRLATRKDPLTNSESYVYDANGNLSQFTDRIPQVTSYTYDGLNRRTRVTYAGPTTTDYTYDDGNRLMQVVDSIAGTITRTYDDLDRLTSETTPQGSVSYTYDNGGRRATMTASGQSTVNYTYDDANRLTQITQDTAVVTFGYDDAGRRTSLTLPNGIVVQYSYDKASRLTELKYMNGAVELGNLLYLYDKAGNRSKVGGTFARTSLPQAIASATYNNANRQTALGGKSMVFDKNGNLTSITESGATTTYTWNSRNKLISISGLGVSASFVYDGLGRREKKTINGNLTEFLFDGINPIQETSGATVLANTLTGLSIDEFFNRSDMSAGTTSYFLPAALGSTLALTDSLGVIQTEYTYEPFGKTTATGTSDSNSFQYTARDNDGTGLQYNRSRYYNNSSQRFISEDPLDFGGGDVNLYAYAGNNPIDRIDPFGLDWVDNAADFSAGLGSALTLGVTDFLNDGIVNKCSGWHTLGNVTGIALTTAIGAAGLPGGLSTLSNTTKGNIGEILSFIENTLMGSTNVAIRKATIPASRTVVDSTWRSLSGAVYYVESKFGKSTLTAAQRAAANALGDQYVIERWGYDFFGRVGGYLGFGYGAAGAMSGRSCGCN